MNEQQAEAVATSMNGEAWQSGGGIWLVLVRRDDGALVVLSDDSICLYADEDAFDRGESLQCIELRATKPASR